MLATQGGSSNNGCRSTTGSGCGSRRSIGPGSIICTQNPALRGTAFGIARQQHLAQVTTDTAGDLLSAQQAARRFTEAPEQP